VKKDPKNLSVRDRVTRNRDWYFVLSTHIKLTVEEFRQHLTDELRPLRLSEQTRQGLMTRIVPAPHVSVPTDSRFWQVLQHADEMEQLYHPAHPDCRADRWARNFFGTDFARHYGESAPGEWHTMAERIFSVLRQLREDARMELRTISNQLRKSWEGGQTHALVEAVRAMIREPWVSQAIFDQQQRQRTGTAKEKRDAAGILKLVGEATKGIGKGNTEKLSLEEKETVEADYRYWLSVFKKLNKPFKQAWNSPAWKQASEETRQEMRERLAKECALSLEEVGTAERYLKSSAKGGLATPTEAAEEIVAEKYNLGAGTVEKVHQELKKRKTLTTPTAERTA